MKTVDLAQGTPEWLSWRNGGIGGSDAPVIAGSSPYRTPLQLFREKRGLESGADEEDNEFIFSKGHRVEGRIRKGFAELTGVTMHPVCVEHRSIEFMRASLDGLDSKLGVLEAKLVGKAVLEQARSRRRMKIFERIPLHHYTQIQHSLEVADHDGGHWFGHDGSELGALLEIPRDRKFIATLIDQEASFWEMVKRGEAPPLSARDYLIPENTALLAELRDAKVLAENAQIAFEQLRAKVAEMYQHPRIAGGGVKMYRTERKGSLNLLSVPEIEVAVAKAKKKLKEDYLETFRGKTSVSWTVRIDSPKAKEE